MHNYCSKGTARSRMMTLGHITTDNVSVGEERVQEALENGTITPSDLCLCCCQSRSAVQAAPLSPAPRVQQWRQQLPWT